jgi:hypothetical protein
LRISPLLRWRCAATCPWLCTTKSCRCDKIRTTLWPGLWRGRCWWSTASTVARKMFIQNVTQWGRNVQVLAQSCCSHTSSTTPVSLSCGINHTSNIA